MSGDYSFPAEHWSHISDSAKNLVRGLLAVDSKQRMTTGQVLAHPWIAGNTASKIPLPLTHSTALKLLVGRRKLRDAVRVLMVANNLKWHLKQVSFHKDKKIVGMAENQKKQAKKKIPPEKIERSNSKNLCNNNNSNNNLYHNNNNHNNNENNNGKCKTDGDDSSSMTRKI